MNKIDRGISELKLIVDKYQNEVKNLNDIYNEFIKIKEQFYRKHKHILGDNGLLKNLLQTESKYRESFLLYNILTHPTSVKYNCDFDLLKKILEESKN